MNRRLIVVVDDMPDCAAMIELALAPLASVDVEITGSAEEALARLGQLEVAALITDMELPGMSGLELIAAARARHPALPVVVVSGAVNGTAAAAIRAGAAAFFRKPFSPADVRHTVERLIDAH